ncbi:MAG: hypothetical protein MR727_03765 [Lentisphaeria bacterium]|nr:hypothetical protein [Lentisphaeria bacterium]
MTKTASVVFLLLMTFLVRADVFSLWPSRGGSSGVNNALQSETLWTEEVKINGHSLNLEVSLVDRTLQEALHDLRGVYKNGSAAVNSNSLLFEIPLRSGAKKRYYLVELNGIVPMLQFSMVLPADFRRGVPSVWPAEFPLPPGAGPQTVMQFPKRHSLYGAFQSPYLPQQTLTDLVRGLESRGWKNAGRETVSSGNASGEFFLSNDGKEVLIVTVQPSPAQNGGCSGSLYLRRLTESK